MTSSPILRHSNGRVGGHLRPEESFCTSKAWIRQPASGTISGRTVFVQLFVTFL